MPLSSGDEAAEGLQVGCEHLGNVLHQSALSMFKDRAAQRISKVRQMFTYHSCIGFGFYHASKEGLETEKSIRRNNRKSSSLMDYK